MTVGVNLLPEAYRKARRRDRWFQRGAVTGAVLLVAELFVGLMLYVRAGDERDLVAAIEEARARTREVDREITKIDRQAAAVRKNLTLAEQLRATHRWSRLLGAMAAATPDGVMLAGLSTDPAEWTQPKEPVGFKRPGGIAPKAAETDKESDEENITGITISGYAIDYASLSQLMTTLHHSEMFALIDTPQTAPGKVDGQEAVWFKFQGRW